jgi:glutamine amidotransferase
MNQIIQLIDYGMGNLLSVQRAFEFIGVTVERASSPEEITLDHKLVLPGVGAFPDAMRELGARRLIPVIREAALKGLPILGICLGMQLLLDESEEFSITSGLGLIPGRVTMMPRTINENAFRRIPHIGWARLRASNQDSKSLIYDSANEAQSVYFVHSYMANISEPKVVVAEVDYLGLKIPAIIEDKNVVGCQFHPEKSGQVGLNILKNFAAL